MLMLDAETPLILIVEDDESLCHLLRDYLSAQDFRVQTAMCGEGALGKARGEVPDAVVLDLMLPGIDGFEVCRRLRTFYAGPILMLTASKADADQVQGLELGADDFVNKPVDPRVLLARLRALLRRAGGERGPVVERLDVGDFVVDRGQREAFVGSVALGLTSAEFDIVWMLAQRAGECVSRDEMYLELRGYEYDGLDRGMDIHVARIRRKLLDHGLEGAFIKAVRGVGYQMVSVA